MSDTNAELLSALNEAYHEFDELAALASKGLDSADVDEIFRQIESSAAKAAEAVKVATAKAKEETK